MVKVNNYFSQSSPESISKFFEIRLEGFKAAHQHVQLEDALGPTPNPYSPFSLEYALFKEGFDCYIKEFAI